MTNTRKMKKTPYVCVTAMLSKYNVTQRVYEDDEGKKYIRSRNDERSVDGYLCIDNLPCVDTMFRA